QFVGHRASSRASANGITPRSAMIVVMYLGLSLCRCGIRREYPEPQPFIGIEVFKGVSASLKVLLLPLHEPDQEVGPVVMLRQFPGEVGLCGGRAARKHLQISSKSCWRFFSRTSGTGSPEKSAVWMTCQNGESSQRPRLVSCVGTVWR